MPTDKEYIEMGKKAEQARIKDRERTRIVYRATKKLISAHQPEYEEYLREEEAIARRA